jgi:hypothetical protein
MRARQASSNYFSNNETGTGLRFRMSHLWKVFYVNNVVSRHTYLEYESQSQGIKPQSLPKQKEIIIVRLQRTTKRSVS